MYSLYLENDLNRVFTGSVAAVAATELRLVADALLAGTVGSIEPVVDGRTQVLRFEAGTPTEALAAVVGQLSASSALLAHEGGGLLRPVAIAERLTYGTELVTTQRYRGKTSERLTRAMLNVALAVAGVPLGPSPPPATVLDPMCGRGTTLNWALAYGCRAIGIEVDRTALDEHARFLRTWAKRARWPHKAVAHRPGNAERRHTTMRVGVDRATLKSGRGQEVETFAADGTDVGLRIGRRSVDVVVTDLPYGVQHRGANRRASATDTLELLTRGLPAWRRWLRPGGSVVLAWNTKRTARPVVAEAVGAAGFEVIEPPDGLSMAHAVDTTIDRDVLAARLPRRAE